jgi:hypothetical protein
MEGVMPKEVKTFEVSITMTFNKLIDARDKEYALQKARFMADRAATVDLFEGATNVNINHVDILGEVAGKARLHGTRRTGWPEFSPQPPAG